MNTRVLKNVFRGVEVEMVLIGHWKHNGKVERLYYILKSLCNVIIKVRTKGVLFGVGLTNRQ